MIALSASLVLFSDAAARDLGVHGNLFPVAEPDLIEQIYARLHAMERAGDIARLNQELAERARSRVARPAPVNGLGATQEPRSFLIDPSITLAADIRDHEGRLIHAAGERVNPLDHQELSQTLLFIDGDDDAQIGWALAAARERAPAQVILVRGAPLDLMKRHEIPVFFDQGGYLVSRLGIGQTPAMVRQEGRALRVSEVRP